MSTSFAPYGFRPSRSNVGEVRLNEYPIASTYATSLYKGDPVLIGTDGNIAASATAGTSTQIGQYLGVFQGVKSQTFVRGWSEFYPASTTAADLRALVYDDPDTIWQVEMGTTGTGTGTTQALVGLNVNFQLGTGSALLGKSGAYIDANVAGTTGTAIPFKVLKFVDQGTNAPGGNNGANGTTSDAYPELEVIWNANAHFKRNTTGV